MKPSVVEPSVVEPSGGGLPLSTEPPSPDVVVVLQMPLVEPIGRMHVEPRQQSALIVQPPSGGTQVVPPSGML